MRKSDEKGCCTSTQELRLTGRGKPAPLVGIVFATPPTASAALMCLAIALGNARAALMAQAVSSLTPGVRIRITAPTTLIPPRQAGSLVALRGDSMVIRPDGSDVELVLATRQVAVWEVSRGRQSAKRQWAVGGAVVGGAVGAVYGAATWQPPDPNCREGFLGCGLPDNRMLDAVAVGALGAAVGAAAGTIVGGQRWFERWERVAAPADTRLGIGAARGRGVVLSLAARF